MLSDSGLRQKAEKAAVKKRQQNENIRQNISEKRSEEMIRNTILWRDRIIPKWKSVRDSSKVYTLATKGIPPCLRRQVWQLMIGNEIVVTEDVYRSLHEKAVTRYQQVQQREKLYTAAKQQQRQFAASMTEAGGDDVLPSPPVDSRAEEQTAVDLSASSRRGRSKSQDVTARHLDEEYDEEPRVDSAEQPGGSGGAKGAEVGPADAAPSAPCCTTPLEGVVRTLRLRSYSANDSNNNTSSNGTVLANVMLAGASSASASLTPVALEEGCEGAAESTEGWYSMDDPVTVVDGSDGGADAPTRSDPGPDSDGTPAAFHPETPATEDEITRTINKFNRTHHYTGLGMDYSAIKAGPVLTPDISALGSRTQGGPSNVTPLLATPMLQTPRARLDSAPVDSGHKFDTVALIQYDLPRTFPTLGFFHDGGPLNDALNKVLHAFSCFRPDVGYVQGMSFIVAMLLLYMSELEAFQALINLVGRRACLEFYRLKKEAIDNYVQVFNYFFKQTLPMLFDHFQQEGVTSEMYLLDWNLSLFCKALPLEVAARIWDCYLLEGEVFIVRTALGLLRMYAPRLCVQSMEQIMKILVHFPDDIDVDEILANIQHIKISNKKYEQMRHRYDMQDLSLAGVTATASARSTTRSGKSGKFPILTALGLYSRAEPEKSQGDPFGSFPVSEANSPSKDSCSGLSPASCDGTPEIPANAKPRNPKQVQAEHEARMRLMQEVHASGGPAAVGALKQDKDDDNCVIM